MAWLHCNWAAWAYFTVQPSVCCCAILFLGAGRQFPPNYKWHVKKYKEEKPLNIYSGFLRDFRLVLALNREGGTASARGFGIGVADNKL